MRWLCNLRDKLRQKDGGERDFLLTPSRTCILHDMRCKEMKPDYEQLSGYKEQ